jgi:hypothetical protein
MNPTQSPLPPEAPYLRCLTRLLEGLENLIAPFQNRFHKSQPPRVQQLDLFDSPPLQSLTQAGWEGSPNGGSVRKPSSATPSHAASGIPPRDRLKNTER